MDGVMGQVGEKENREQQGLLGTVGYLDWTDSRVPQEQLVRRGCLGKRGNRVLQVSLESQGPRDSRESQGHRAPRGCRGSLGQGAKRERWEVSATEETLVLNDLRGQ